MGLPANICLQIIGSFLPSTSTLFLQPHFTLRLWQTAYGFHLLPRQVGSPCSAVSQRCVMQNILRHPSFFALILSSRHFFSVPGVVVVPSFEADENQNPPASKAELDECISAQRCRGVLEVVHISSHLTPHTSHLTLLRNLSRLTSGRAECVFVCASGYELDALENRHSAVRNSVRVDV